MPEYNTAITIQIADVESRLPVVVNYHHQPAEPQGWDCPGSAEEVDIRAVNAGARNLLSWLDSDQVEALTVEILSDIRATAEDPESYDEEAA